MSLSYSIHKPTGQQLAKFDQNPARRYGMMGGLSRGLKRVLDKKERDCKTAPHQKNGGNYEYRFKAKGMIPG